MNKKGLAILLRTRMRPTDPTNLPYSPNSLNNVVNQNLSNSEENRSNGGVVRYVPEQGKSNPNSSSNKTERDFEHVRESMHSAISMNKTEVLDSVLNDFSEGYFSLSYEFRRRLLLVLAKEYDLNRTQVRDLIKQYLGLELPTRGDNAQSDDHLEEESMLSSFYRIERNLRLALKPMYEVLFERLNTHPGGLKFLSILRSDILSIIAKENFASLRALDSYLKEKLSTWLSPAALELHQITWDDPASLLEKIVAFEAVHPISNLIDLKRRLGVGRRCFGYFHSAIPGEPLIFIEVALMKNIAQTIQEVLWDDPPIPEREATCALFYSISSTQPGLSGINLGKFLIKRVITLVKRDMPHISAFATLSPIPGYMQWLLSKLASQLKLAEGEIPAFSSANSDSTFWENILEPEEESELMEASSGVVAGNSGMEVTFKLLTSMNYEWTNSTKLLSVLKTPLMRLCARYLLQEKKRGKALDSVANFHLQNGAMIERINWMADRSEKGLRQSGGIMVNYVYRVESIEEYSHSYFSTGQIHSSSDLCHLVELKAEPERQ
ncbi:Malonyl-CoA decarboxylase [Parasponia andersonii]|uniref:Malonyl-CoA decarboxylase n=1 Tax=Parasponia andersonii TaxID=3476 RepID=A0A2P5BTP8_PARAD|nr:Malonyl-CoA decarboxylase [Parasponia andersonii]